MRIFQFATLIKRIIIITLFSICISLLPFFQAITHSASGNEFNPSNIIDDSVFFAPNAISDNEIQAFLNAKMLACDTNGAQAYNATTRSAYGTSKGYPPPYICLKDYVQQINGASGDQFCSGVGSGRVSAAQIIGAVSRACGINPKVLIVLLQKEQALVTDDWPWQIQYTKATGMGCPDSTLSTADDANQNGCYDEYEGFFKQIYFAARQLKRYAVTPQYFKYSSARTSFVSYKDNRPDCGGTNITPQNAATAALYNYTPYQPNAASLNNLYGEGDACSSYGNRNFWRLFIDWFGSVRINETWAYSVVSQEIYSDNARTIPFSGTPTVQPGGKYYTRLKVLNVGTQTWNSSFLKLGTSNQRDRSSIFAGPEWLSANRAASSSDQTVLPGQLATFDAVYTAPTTPGSYREYFSLVADGRSWLNGPEKYFSLNVVVASPPSGSEEVMVSGDSLQPGDYKLSSDKKSVLTLQKDGNLVLYQNFIPVWQTSTLGSSPEKLVLQPDGNLVLYGNSKALWSTNTFGAGNASLNIQSDGNLVLYKESDSTALYTTGTFHNPNLLNYVNNQMSYSAFYPLQQLESTGRKYQLILQPDGNLVLYSNNKAVWSTNTFGSKVNHAILQPDGNLVLYSNNKAVWSTGSIGKNGSRLILQDDGNLVLYTVNDQPVWQSSTLGR